MKKVQKPVVAKRPDTGKKPIAHAKAHTKGMVKKEGKNC